MSVAAETIQETETIIKSYFCDMLEIARLKSKLNILIKNQQETQHDLETNNDERLEKQLADITNKIIESKIMIRELENKNTDINFVINQLPGEDRRLIVLMYQEKFPFSRISLAINLSTSAIGERKKRIFKDVSAMLQ